MLCLVSNEHAFNISHFVASLQRSTAAVAAFVSARRPFLRFASLKYDVKRGNTTCRTYTIHMESDLYEMQIYICIYIQTNVTTRKESINTGELLGVHCTCMYSWGFPCAQARARGNAFGPYNTIINLASDSVFGLMRQSMRIYCNWSVIY